MTSSVSMGQAATDSRLSSSLTWRKKNQTGKLSLMTSRLFMWITEPTEEIHDLLITHSLPKVSWWINYKAHLVVCKQQGAMNSYYSHFHSCNSVIYVGQSYLIVGEIYVD